MRQLIHLAPAAPLLAGLGLGLIGLSGGGSAGGAALFGAVMAAALLATLGLTSPVARAAAVRRAAWPAAALALYFAYGAATAVWLPPFAEGLAHPLWGQFGLDRVAVSIAPYRTLEGLAAAVGPAAALLGGILLGAERSARPAVRRGLLLLAIVVIAAALVWRSTAFGGRLTAALPSPNVAATLFAVFAFCGAAACARAAQAKGLVRAPLALGVLFLAVGALLLSGSRAGAAAFVIGLVVFGMVLRAGRWRWVLAGAVGALALVGGGLLAVRAVALSADFSERMLLWRPHAAAIVERPLLGHGLNTFYELNLHYAEEGRWAEAARAGSAHNLYMQTWEESGVGALLLLCAAAIPLSVAVRRVILGGSSDAWGAAAICASLAAGLHATFDFALQIPAVAALLAFVVGAFAWRAPAGAPRARPLATLVLAAAFSLGSLFCLEVWRQAEAAQHASGANPAPLAAGLLEPTWHAGALRARALVSPGAVARRKAIEASVQLSPLQAEAWASLAATQASICAPLECLEHSVLASPVAPPMLACARLGRALELEVDRDRLSPFLRALTRPEFRDAPGACLALLPPGSQSSALLMALASASSTGGDIKSRPDRPR